jgi:hypothetical protein
MNVKFSAPSGRLRRRHGWRFATRLMSCNAIAVLGFFFICGGPRSETSIAPNQNCDFAATIASGLSAIDHRAMKFAISYGRKA